MIIKDSKRKIEVYMKNGDATARKQDHDNHENDNIVQHLRGHLTESLSRVYKHYSHSQLEQIADQLLEAMPPKVAKSPKAHENLWTEKEVVLITYGDSIVNHREPPLEVLRQFLKNHLSDVLTTVHILPFYPFTSDDGFSVVDYCQVNPQLGEWEHVEKLAEDFHIMFDAVVNHISSASRWFQTYLTSQKDDNLFFTEASPHEDTSMVTRPRTSPLLRRVDTVRGERYVWCTFSHDQVDLNFGNPNLFIEVVKVFQYYLDHGASWFRLDAIAFIWKELGTTCINLPEAHELIKIMRLLLEHAHPEAVVVTETNVPIHENLAYFGNANEAHVIYNFSLPPLLVHSLLSQDASYLKKWLLSLPNLQDGTAYLNFIASHDGIGLRPAEGLLPDEEIDQMKQHVKASGGYLTDRMLPTGDVKTYEMNISLFDALSGTFEAGKDEFHIARFVSAYAIAFGLAGIPAVYIHSFLATPNDHERYERTGVNRAVNRHVWNADELDALLDDQDSDQYQVLQQLKKLLRIRCNQPAFHPNAAQHIMHLSSNLLGFHRHDPVSGQKIFAIYNMSRHKQDLSVYDLNLSSLGRWTNLVNGECYFDPSEHIALAPYEFVWLTDLYFD